MLTNKGKYGLKAMVHLAGLPPAEVAHRLAKCAASRGRLRHEAAAFYSQLHPGGNPEAPCSKLRPRSPQLPGQGEKVCVLRAQHWRKHRSTSLASLNASAMMPWSEAPLPPLDGRRNWSRS